MTPERLENHGFIIRKSNVMNVDWYRVILDPASPDHYLSYINLVFKEGYVELHTLSHSFVVYNRVLLRLLNTLTTVSKKIGQYPVGRDGEINFKGRTPLGICIDITARGGILFHVSVIKRRGTITQTTLANLDATFTHLDSLFMFHDSYYTNKEQLQKNRERALKAKNLCRKAMPDANISNTKENTLVYQATHSFSINDNMAIEILDNVYCFVINGVASYVSNAMTDRYLVKVLACINSALPLLKEKDLSIRVFSAGVLVYNKKHIIYAGQPQRLDTIIVKRLEDK